ncbi:hypothetical protein ACFV4Q_12675 [Streptomyces nojiriensis]|uniref:hypothetical protein n=1 Tax=Streptomyces nojiriensis TaxID=66374 RepID=UPI0036665071
MAGPWDASINLLHFAVDKGEFIAPTLGIGKEFDVRAEIEIGNELRGFATAYQLVVNVQNLSTGVVASCTVPGSLTPTRGILRTPLVVDFPQLAANEGDLLRASCSLRVTAGIHTDYSVAESEFAIAEIPES